MINYGYKLCMIMCASYACICPFISRYIAYIVDEQVYMNTPMRVCQRDRHAFHPYFSKNLIFLNFSIQNFCNCHQTSFISYTPAPSCS